MGLGGGGVQTIGLGYKSHNIIDDATFLQDIFLVRTSLILMKLEDNDH